MEEVSPIEEEKISSSFGISRKWTDLIDMVFGLRSQLSQRKMEQEL